MGSPILSFALSGLGRDAIKAAAGLLAGLVIALAFAISSIMALLVAAVPGAGQQPAAYLAPAGASNRPGPENPPPLVVLPSTDTASNAVVRALANIGSQ